MKQIYILSILFLFSIGNVMAKKPDIQGTIKTEANLPVEFANVVVINSADSAIVKAGITDVDGNYIFENLPIGSYKLMVVQVGFNKYYSETFQLTESGSALKFHQISLTENAISLKEASIVASKPFIEHHIDKTVVNVENSSINAGSTAIEILKRSPGVTVDNDGNISLSGKQGVNVMIDGKPTYLSAKELYDMLRNMSSEQLSHIDIITNPSAKYDAAGNSGIIDLHLKKRQDRGLNGVASGSFGQGVYPDAGGALSLNFRKEKFNLFGSYDHSEGWYFEKTSLNRRFFSNGENTTFTQSNYGKGKYTNRDYKAGIDYYFNKKQSLSLVFRGNNSKNTDNNNSTTLIKNSEIVDSSFTNNNQSLSTWKSYNVSMNYQYKIDSLGKELSFDADLARYDNADNSTFLTYHSYANGAAPYTELATNTQPAIINIKSVKFDYTQPWKKKMKIEAGAKTSFVTTDNDVKYYNFNNGIGVIDTGKANHFNYKENINAAYITWSGEIKKWGFQIGLRGEQTISQGVQTVHNATFDRDYFQVFPSAFLDYKFNDNHSARATYSKRIDRPAYQELNPFRSFLDAYTYNQGNPFLKPQLTDNYELSYTFKQLYTLTFNFSHTDDQMTKIAIQDDQTHTTYVTTENLASNDNYGLNLSLPIHVNDWWTSSNNFALFNNHFKGLSSSGYVDLALTSYFINSVNSFQFKKGWSVEVSGYYQSQMVWGTWLVDPQWSASIGIGKSFFKDRLNVKLNLNDIFHTEITKADVKIQNIDANFKQSYDSQFGRIHLSYSFGKKNIQTKRHNNGSEEENRIQKGH